MLAKFFAASALFALSVKAVTHTVIVGDGGLVFNPAELTGVANGDDIAFQFKAKNHTVSQSTFAEPCKQMPNGVNSGFMLTPNGTTDMPTWTITVNDVAEPLWFYCRQKTPADHCAAGMVLSVNPTAEKSHSAFVEKAKASASGAASGGAGGASGAAASGSSSSSGSSTASSEASTAAETGSAEPGGAGTAAAANAADQPATNSARSAMVVSLSTVLAVVGGVAALL